MNVPQRKILAMRVAVTSYKDAGRWILQAAGQKMGRYICVSNVHMCMETHDDQNFREIVNNADLVIPDGKPLVWAQKLLGEKGAEQVRGTDLLLFLCSEAGKRNIPIGLYGSSPDILRDFQVFLKKEFPSLTISCVISPPFRPLTDEENVEYIKQINESGAQILFVSLGCPKQEKWMAEHKDRISCVMLGVGAAFDFLSGRGRNAPRWMQKIGLEWVFRLACEPRRLWKRYFKHNPRFVWYFGKQLIREKVYKD